MNAPTLHTERLILRPLAEKDFPAMEAFYASDRSRFVGGPLDAERTWRALATEIGHWTLRGYGRFAVEEKESGAFCGVIGPWNPLGWPEPELGWDLMNGFEGKGYATEAAKATRDYAYQTLGWNTAISLITPDNMGSAKVATRLGAVLEGEFNHSQFGILHVYRHPAPELEYTS